MTTLGVPTVAPAALGFDTNTAIDADVATALHSQGYTFCMRYVSLLGEAPSDLSNEEATTVLDAGLLLGVVQHATKSRLDSGLGTENGENTASNAASIGVPAGVTLWCDIEGTNSASSDDTVEYINAWAAAVTGAKYIPGLYVGPNSGLSASELSHSLSIAHYWKSSSEVPWVEQRGFQMVQGHRVATSAGICIDPDVSCYDAMGDRFTLVGPG